MSVESRIVAALKPMGYPVENAVYHGDAKKYYTFLDNTIGTDYADDAPNHEKHLVSVHFFAPLSGNISADIKATKRALFAAGFTWPEVINASDDTGRHFVFECEDVEGVDVDGDDGFI